VPYQTGSVMDSLSDYGAVRFFTAQPHRSVGANATFDQHAADNLAKRETSRLIACDKVEGTTVKNRTGETLGSIHDVMIDKFTGKVAYAVMSFGGFLGIGERYHPLPWSVLTYDPDAGAYVAISTSARSRAPRRSTATRQSMGKTARGARVHDYYKVPPYWM
jgi:hypothetical protein